MPKIYALGTLVIDGVAYNFGVTNDKNEGFEHANYTSLAYNIVSDLNAVLNKHGIMEEVWKLINRLNKYI